MPEKKNNGVSIPADLSALSADELTALEETALAEVDRISGDPNIDASGLATLTQLADGVESIRNETSARQQAAAELAAGVEAQLARVRPAETGEPEGEEGEEAPVEGAPAEPAPAPALVAATPRPRSAPVLKDGNRLNIRLSDAARAASTNRVPTATPFDASVLVASADIPGFTTGGRIEDMNSLIEAFQRRGRSLPIGRALAAGRRIEGEYMDAASNSLKYGLLGHEGDWRTANRVPIASLQREFRHVLDPNSTPQKMWDVMQEAARADSLVAAGGWCSPSEIRYDFYNIVAMDGALDLPTAGISRGGMRWPTSPSFGDLASSTGLWHWTETQDIAAATGTAQSGTKTCARVPCAAFNEARLEGEGICITAGNLTTDAWPEQISNFLRLVNAAHFHRVNSFFVSAVIAGSTAVTLTQTNSSPVTDILAGVEHQVWDIRTKFAMADTDVLEVVFPSWVKGLIRADVSRRTGMASADNSFAVTDAMIASWFTERYVRVQFVQDFDVRAANQFGQQSATALQGSWPTTVRFIIYPAGTWLRGNGLNLDLGIIRDSTLNANNDYTAAWSEEFFLLAKIGHESRVVTLGTTGSVPTGTTAIGLTATGV